MDAKYLAQKWLVKLLQPRCSLCGLPCETLQLPLCTHCYSALPFWRQGCSCCGMPLPELAAVNTLCGDCQRQPKPYQSMHLLGWYTDELKALVMRFKYQHDLVAGKALVQAWLNYAVPSSLPQCLIPVPCHRHKLASRGFNQAAFIADHLSRALTIPLELTLCQRIAEGQASVTQTKKQRMRQVKKLYRSVHCPYQHVALVDDVVTSQATVQTLSAQLLQQGAKRVDVWALARTP